jgi:hypothetical protein
MNAMRKPVAFALALMLAAPAAAQITTLGAGNAGASGGGGGGAVTLDPAFHDANVSVTADGGLTATRTSSTGDNMVRATKAIPAGGACWAMLVNARQSPADQVVGVIDSTNVATGTATGGNSTSGGFIFNGAKLYNGSTAGSLGIALTNGVWVMVFYKPSSKNLHIYVPTNGWDVAGSGDIVADTGGFNLTSIGSTVYPSASLFDLSASVTFNFGSTSFDASLSTATSDCTTGGYPTLQAAP